MNLVSMLSAQVDRRPHAAAFIDGRAASSRTTAYAELERQSQQAAALLRARGLHRGDRVLILHAMSPELYAALIGVLRLGLVAVFVEPSAGLQAIDRCCAAARPRAFVGGARAQLLRAVSPAIRRIPLKFSVGMRVPGAVPWRAEPMTGTVPIENVGDGDPALLTLTSGSTGAPKAAVRSHGFLRAQYKALQNVLHLEGGEVDLTTMPIVTLANLASGVTSVIPDADLRAPGSISAPRILEQLDRHGVTRTAASPALLDRLVDACLATRRTLPRLKRIFTGGGPVFPGLLERVQRVAPNANLTAVYGSSEAEPIAAIQYSDMSEEDRAVMTGGHGLLAGRPVPTLQLRILRDRTGTPVGPYSQPDFDRACLGPGDAGEIVVSGAHVLAGYLDGAGDDETKICVDGVVWHRTGDAGLMDTAGRLWLLGRSAARVEDARGVLYPFTVECAAQQRADVRRAALVARNGRRILAVELRRSLDADGARALKQSLAWAGIDAICAYPQLPVDRRHNAKIDYGALQKLIDRRPAATIG